MERIKVWKYLVCRRRIFEITEEEEEEVEKRCGLSSYTLLQVYVYWEVYFYPLYQQQATDGLRRI